MAKAYAWQSNAEFKWRLDPDPDTSNNIASKVSYQQAYSALLYNLNIESRKAYDKETLEEMYVRLNSLLWRRINQYSSWIVIFDNAGSYTDIDKYLPPNDLSRAGIILVTTHNPTRFKLYDTSYRLINNELGKILQSPNSSIAKILDPSDDTQIRKRILCGPHAIDTSQLNTNFYTAETPSDDNHSPYDIWDVESSEDESESSISHIFSGVILENVEYDNNTDTRQTLAKVFQVRVLYLQARNINDTASRTELLQLAEQGNVPAQAAIIALIINRKQGPPLTQHRVVQCLIRHQRQIQKSAVQNDIYAQFCLAMMYVSGIVMNKNGLKGIVWLGRAAKLGLFEAREILTMIYRKRLRQYQPLEPLRKAAEQGNIDAKWSLAVLYQLRGAYDPALRIYRDLEETDPRAMLNIGVMYLQGQGVKKNLDEGFKCIFKAAERGDSIAMIVAAKCYAFGNGVQQSNAQAISWLNKAMEAGESQAAEILSQAYATGKLEVKENQTYARQLYENAVQLRMTEPMQNQIFDMVTELYPTLQLGTIPRIQSEPPDTEIMDDSKIKLEKSEQGWLYLNKNIVFRPEDGDPQISIDNFIFLYRNHGTPSYVSFEPYIFGST